MKRVIVESPYAPRDGHTIEDHLRYLRACLQNSIHQGEAPYASHALYTQPGVLRDEVPGERALGIAAGFAWRETAELTVFYEDMGWSSGMLAGLADCEEKGHPYEIRRLGTWDTGLAATDRWGAPTGIVSGGIAPMKAADVRMPTDAPAPVTGDVGPAVAEIEGIHVPEIISLDPVVVGPRTVELGTELAWQIIRNIEKLPLTQQAGNTIAIALTLLHYSRYA